MDCKWCGVGLLRPDPHIVTESTELNRYKCSNTHCTRSGASERMYRPDLTDYKPYIDLLTDRLNEESLFKMTGTDAIKILIEREIDKLCKDIEIKKTRKLFYRLKF